MTELLNDFYEFLELHDHKLFRNKMKGLRINPFDMRDNYQRIKEGEIKYQPKI